MNALRRYNILVLTGVIFCLGFSFFIKYRLVSGQNIHSAILPYLSNQRSFVDGAIAKMVNGEPIHDSLLIEFSTTHLRIKDLGKDLFKSGNSRGYFVSYFDKYIDASNRLFKYYEKYNRTLTYSQTEMDQIIQLSKDFEVPLTGLVSMSAAQLSDDLRIITWIDLIFYFLLLVFLAALYLYLSRPAEIRMQKEKIKLAEFEEAISIATLIVVCEESGFVIEANTNFLKKYGLQPKEIEHFNLWEHQKKYNDVLVTNQAWTSCGKGNIWRGEIKGASLQNDVFYTDRTIIPLKSDASDHFGRLRFLVIESDITDRHTYQTELETKNQQLSEYAFVTSHKVRAPLTSILGLVDIIDRQCEVIDNGEGIVEKLRSAGNELDSVVKELNNLVSLRELKNSKIKFVQENEEKKSISTVYLIDDDKIVNFINRKIITTTEPGIRLHDFNEAKKALETIEKDKPDLILLDINMPVMNGWDFLDELVRRNLSTTVFMLSSSIDPSDRLKASNYPMVRNFISKPLTAESLKTILIQ